MTEKELKKAIRHSLHQTPLPAEDAHAKQTLCLVYRQVGSALRCRRISFSRFLWIQFIRTGWKLWAIQGAFLLLSVRLLSALWIEEAWRRPLFFIKLLCCLSVLLLMSALPLLYRSVRCHMQETEAASYFSSQKLLLAKLSIIGIGDALFLCGIFFATLQKTALGANSAAFYLCFPFLLAGSGCLFLLGHAKAGHFFVGSLGLCTFLLLLSFVLGRYQEALLLPASPAGWILLCLLLVVFLCQLRYLISRAPCAELQIA